MPKHTTKRAVWKFPVPLGTSSDVFTITMPEGAEPLTVQVQSSEPQIWALVNPENPLTSRRFRMAGTGHPISEEITRYVGTFQVFGGSLIFHVFEVSV